MKTVIKDMKNYIILILIIIFAHWGLNNLEMLIKIIKTIYKVFAPFIIGGIIAFILNIPITKIENYLKKHMKREPKTKIIRIISITISLLVFFAIVIFIAFLLIPELIENIELLMNSLPNLINKAETFILDLLDEYPDIQKEIKKMFSETGNISNMISNILNYIINTTVLFITSLVSSFVMILTSIIFSIYVLSQKEYLIRGSKKVVYATLNKEYADKLLEIGKLANKIFSKFISGQCVEAVILGFLMFIAFNIFNFPYALIIAVLTAVTALIPIFGALIAMVVGAILIGISNPVQVVVFLIVFLVIQQIEGNFIYPKVVGKSVGLPPMWTLLAITVGGNLFGIPGMLLGLPIASIAYALAKSTVNDKLKEKEIRI